MTARLLLTGVVLIVSLSAVAGVLNPDAGSGAVLEEKLEGTATPEPTATPSESTPAPEPTPEPSDTGHRADCGEIRGTDYVSPEERQWFLANCVRD